MKILMVLNDSPYGTERTYNGRRLAINLVAKSAEPDPTSVDVFLMEDAAGSAKADQSTPNGYSNIEKMLHGVIRRRGTVQVRGTCMDARGLTQEQLTEGALRSTLNNGQR